MTTRPTRTRQTAASPAPAAAPARTTAASATARPAATRAPRPFVYRSFLGDKSGYSLAAHMDIAALSAVGADFGCCSLSPTPIPTDDALFGPHQRAARERFADGAWDRPGVHLVRNIPTDVFASFERARSDRRLPGYSLREDQRVGLLTVYESPVWPRGWVSATNCYDRVSVPSQWLATCAQQAGVTVPIDVIPHALAWPDSPTPNLPPSDPWFDRPTGHEPVRVLVEGTYMARKNLAAAVEAFWRAFRPGQAVLLLHTHWFQPGHRDRLAGELLDARRRLGLRAYAPVLVSDTSLDWSALWSMYAWSTTYLSLARAEGVGYPLIMAAGLGRAIVVSDGPGHRDTVPAATFVPSRTRPARLALDADPCSRFDGFGVSHIHPDDPWQEASVDAAAKALRKHSTTPYPDADALRQRHSLERVGGMLSAFARSLEQP